MKFLYKFQKTAVEPNSFEHNRLRFFSSASSTFEELSFNTAFNQSIFSLESQDNEQRFLCFTFQSSALYPSTRYALLDSIHLFILLLIFTNIRKNYNINMLYIWLLEQKSRAFLTSTPQQFLATLPCFCGKAPKSRESSAYAYFSFFLYSPNNIHISKMIRYLLYKLFRFYSVTMNM